MTYTADIQEWSEAPSGTYNPFASDERCYAVHYITADRWVDVIEAVAEVRAMDNTIVDYDVFEDTAVNKIVGVTCRDV